MSVDFLQRKRHRLRDHYLVERRVWTDADSARLIKPLEAVQEYFHEESFGQIWLKK